MKSRERERSRKLEQMDEDRWEERDAVKDTTGIVTVRLLVVGVRDG